MTLPASWTQVPVTCNYVDLFGAVPEEGSVVVFTPSPAYFLVTDGTASTVVYPRVVRGVVDATGQLRAADGSSPLQLLATNDPDVNPVDWTYRVDEKLRGVPNRTSYSIAVPYDATDVDLARVSPVPSSEGTAIVQGPQGPEGPQGPPGPVSSVDGQTGAVVLSTTYARVFGAPAPSGDTTGATDTAALQALVNKAEAAGGGIVLLLPGTYWLNAALVLPSNLVVQGSGQHFTIVRQATNGVPGMQSKAWADHTYSPAGGLQIRDLRIYGAPGAGAHGLLLLDFYMTIERVDVRVPGDKGIALYGTRSDASDIGFQLVENRLSDITVTGAGTYSLWVDPAGNRVTDGFLDRIATDSGSATPTTHLYFGTSAGWQIGDIHTYGTTTAEAVQVAKAWNTSIDGGQIEPHWTGTGLAGAVEQALTIDNLSIAIPPAGGTAVNLVKYGTNPGDGFTIGTLNVVHEANVAATAISWDNNTCECYVAALNLQGAYAGQITPLAGAGASAVRLASDVKVASPLRDSGTGRTISVNGQLLAIGKTQGWAGNTAQSLTFDIPVPDYTSYTGILTIASATFNNGARLADFVGMVFVSAKTAADPVHASLVNVTTPSGFTTAPAVTATRANGIATVTVTFTATSTDGYGASCALTGSTY